QSAALTQPFQIAVGAKAKGLLASELRVSCVRCSKPIPFYAAQCPFCGSKQPEPPDPERTDRDQDNIPDKWELEHGMNPVDPNDAGADWDNDGFTNLEEYRAGTDIRDPQSHPDVASMLRIQGEVKQTPFKLDFRGFSDMPSGRFFQLNLRSGKTHLKKIGDEVEGFKIQAFEPGNVAREQHDVIVLYDGRETTRLIKGQAQRKIETTADLIYLLDRHTFRVTDNTEFQLQDREKRLTKYKVIDIKPGSVKILDLTLGRETVIPPTTPAEAEALSGGAETKLNEVAPPGTNAAPPGVSPAVKAGRPQRQQEINDSQYPAKPISLRKKYRSGP
ncbi:MAG: hypothetical protein NTV49_12410, partial [Kiritimatiellaeota bacterium]|nr:hypothetical protein [Kiritimatiellota bacterium]